MATSPLGGFANLSSARARADQPVADALTSLIQGAQQGVNIAQLPQTLAQDALSKQIQQAVALSKLQQLQTGSIENVGGRLVRVNPATGQPEILLDAVSQPTNYQFAGFDAQGRPLSFNPRDNSFTSPALPAGVTVDGGLMPKVRQAPTLTKEGLLVDRFAGTASDVNLNDQTLKNVLQDQKTADAASKTAADQALLNQRQTFTAEQNQLNRENQQTLAERRAEAQGVKLNKADEKTVTKLADENASKISIMNQLLAGIETFKDPTIPDEVKVVEGQRLGKILNSTEGKDALQEVERNALLPFLKFERGNPMALFDPTRQGFGRNLAAFQKQLETTAESVNKSIGFSNRHIDSVYKKYGQSYTPDSAISISQGATTPAGTSSTVDRLRQKHNVK